MPILSDMRNRGAGRTPPLTPPRLRRGDRRTATGTDEPPTQAWKCERLIELRFGVPEWLHLGPVDFEKRSSCSGDSKL